MRLSIIAALAIFTFEAMALEVSQKELYENAKLNYNSGDFKTAYESFSRLGVEFFQNSEFNFLLGRSALEMKQYDDALVAFERVLMLNPLHTRTRLELARLYYETEQFELAQEELGVVLKDNLPSNVREVAVAFKSRIDERLTKHHFSIALVMGAGYDDNANNDIGRKEFIIPAYNLSLSGREKESDTNLFATLVINHVYDMGDRGDWSLENSFVAYSKFNMDFDQNDLLLFSFNTAPTWSQQSYKVALPLGYDRIYLDGKGYTYNLSGGVRGTYLVDRTSQLEGGYIHKKGYYDEDSAQDVKNNTLFASYKKAFGDDPILFSLIASHYDNKEVNAGRTDVSSSAWSCRAELSKTFKNSFRTSFSYTATTTDFDDVDMLYGTKRSDDRDEYELGFGYTLRKNLSLATTATYAKNSSNHDPFNYDKVTAMVNAILSF